MLMMLLYNTTLFGEKYNFPIMIFLPPKETDRTLLNIFAVIEFVFMLVTLFQFFNLFLPLRRAPFLHKNFVKIFYFAHLTHIFCDMSRVVLYLYEIGILTMDGGYI